VRKHVYVDEIKNGVVRKVRVSTLGAEIIGARAKAISRGEQHRPAVLIYAGDHDASGDDIFRDFVERTNCWKAVHRVALTKEQVWPDGLDGDPAYPINTGKEDDDGDPTDPRAQAFMERHGYDENFQVEMDAIDPTDLRQLYQNPIDQYWDADAYQAALAREDDDRDRLQVDPLDDDDDDDD
jgi:hypothetical protein